MSEQNENNESLNNEANENVKEELNQELQSTATDNEQAQGTENATEDTQEDKKKKGFFKEAMDWILTLGGAVLVALFITQCLIVNANVPTSSMENTIMPKDRVIANRLSYKFSEPKRFDIVVFKYPDDESTLFVKRIIGLPGDKVDIIDGKVYINDSTEPIADSFIKEPMAKGMDNYNTFYVPEDSYFMLGDNRNNSKDSRYWINTYVKKDKILGKVIFKYYPGISFFKDIEE